MSIAILAISTPCAFAQKMDSDAVRAFLQSEMSRPRTQALPAPGVLQWQQIDLGSLDDQALADLQREVVGKPEHPAKAKIALELAARKGGVIITSRLAWKSSTLWRYDTFGPKQDQSATTVLADQPWRVFAGTLTIMDTDLAKAAADRQQSPAKEEFVFFPLIDRFLHGGVRLFPAESFEITSVRAEADQWQAVVRNKNAGSQVVEIQYTGAYLKASERRRPVVTGRVITRYDIRNEHVGERESYEEWTVGAGGLVHARLVRQFRNTGREWRRYAWSDDPPALESISFSPPEPIEGESFPKGITALYDDREGSVTRTSPTGLVTDVLTPPGERQTGRNPARFGLAALAASIAVSAVICYYLRRKPQHRS